MLIVLWVSADNIERRGKIKIVYRKYSYSQASFMVKQEASPEYPDFRNHVQLIKLKHVIAESQLWIISDPTFLE